MAAWLSEWLRNIIAVILLAVMVELLLPNKAMQRYARLIVGLLILLTIMSPVLKLLQTDFDSRLDAGFTLWEEKAWTEAPGMPSLEEIELKAAELRERQEAEAAKLTERALEDGMKKELELLAAAPPVRKVDVELAWEQSGGSRYPAIVSVTVFLEPGEENGEEGEPAGVGEVEPVQPVFVDIGSGERSGAEAGRPAREDRFEEAAGPAADAVRAAIAAGWPVRPGNVSVVQPANGSS